MAEEVKLLGWGSPFLHRVVWALKWKGVPYEFIEDDFFNKSQLLLQLNPVHKKIPILIHNGKPICESMIIVQYIDENWPQNPLLPADPYQKALDLFWVKFADDTFSAGAKIFVSEGAEQEQAVKTTDEMLSIAEAQCLEGKKFFGGDSINVVDIAFGWVSYWLEIIESASGVKVFHADKFPRLKEWAENFKEVSVVKESIPDHDTTLPMLKPIRESILAASKAKTSNVIP